MHEVGRDEEVFSELKAFFRRARARTDEALRSAIWTALASVNRSDLAGWFSHCGYGTGDRES